MPNEPSNNNSSDSDSLSTINDLLSIVIHFPKEQQDIFRNGFDELEKLYDKIDENELNIVYEYLDNYFLEEKCYSKLSERQKASFRRHRKKRNIGTAELNREFLCRYKGLEGYDIYYMITAHNKRYKSYDKMHSKQQKRLNRFLTRIESNLKPLSPIAPYDFYDAWGLANFFSKKNRSLTKENQNNVRNRIHSEIAKIEEANNDRGYIFNKNKNDSAKKDIGNQHAENTPPRPSNPIINSNGHIETSNNRDVTKIKNKGKGKGKEKAPDNNNDRKNEPRSNPYAASSSNSNQQLNTAKTNQDFYTSSDNPTLTQNDADTSSSRERSISMQNDTTVSIKSLPIEKSTKVEKGPNGLKLEIDSEYRIKPPEHFSTVNLHIMREITSNWESFLHKYDNENVSVSNTQPSSPNPDVSISNTHATSPKPKKNNVLGKIKNTLNTSKNAISKLFKNLKNSAPTANENQLVTNTLARSYNPIMNFNGHTEPNNNRAVTKAKDKTETNKTISDKKIEQYYQQLEKNKSKITNANTLFTQLSNRYYTKKCNKICNKIVRRLEASFPADYMNHNPHDEANIPAEEKSSQPSISQHQNTNNPNGAGFKISPNPPTLRNEPKQTTRDMQILTPFKFLDDNNADYMNHNLHVEANIQTPIRTENNVEAVAKNSDFTDSTYITNNVTHEEIVKFLKEDNDFCWVRKYLCDPAKQ